MKTNRCLIGRSSATLISALVFVVILFGNVLAAETDSQQLSGPGRYQAIYAGLDQSGSGHHHLIIIVDTQTGMIAKSIYYEDGLDKQEITDFVNQDIITIKLGKGEEHRKIEMRK
jgi:hypothetical protein